MKPLQPIPLCHYRYDALDRLIGHTPSDKPQLQRFYCKSRLTTEVQGVIKHSVVQHGDLLLAQQRFEGVALKTSLMATDQQRSVVQTLKAAQPPHPLAYSPYGYRPSENGMLSLLGFNGERSDPVTGHYLLGNGYRAFNPVLMRFNSPDNLSPFEQGGLNSYAYCLGDPINLHDPSGNFALPNFLSKAFKSLLNAMGAKGRSYMSGPEKIFFARSGTGRTTMPGTITIDHVLMADGGWSETTTLIAGQNKDILRNAFGNHNEYRVFDNGVRSTHKTNPLLRELAYSKIPGKKLDEVYNTLDMRPIDPMINKFNRHNALHPDARNNFGKATLGEQIQMIRMRDRLASEGLLNGVRPGA